MNFKIVDPNEGFTSDVIRDPNRFVGRSDLIENCIDALNTPQGLIAVYGKRGVGKSSILRQIQAMANGDYSIAQKAGLHHKVPAKPRKYYTAYYTCDGLIKDIETLLTRLCNDTDETDGFLRLIPDKGKELTEFSRAGEVSTGLDLKIIKWGAKGTDSKSYSRTVPNDTMQTFRNFVTSIVPENNRVWNKRDSVLILLDEFDVIKDKNGFGSLLKSLSSPTIKFAISGIGSDLSALVADHSSVNRLIQEGAINVTPMSQSEVKEIFSTAEQLFKNEVVFDKNVVDEIADLSEGFPYFAQLLGKACVARGNAACSNQITSDLLKQVLGTIREGKEFPTLENDYQRAIGHSKDRAWLLTLLAEQAEGGTLFEAGGNSVTLKKVRGIAKELDVAHVDQNLPRLLSEGILLKDPNRDGVYNFVDPVFRCYVKLRRLD